MKSQSYYLLSLGIIFRSARRKKGLTQKSVAQLCGITEANYHKIEHGEINIGVFSLFRICEVLSIVVKFDNCVL